MSAETLSPLAAALTLVPAAIFWLAFCFPRSFAIPWGNDPPESGGARVEWERDLTLLFVCIALSLLASIYSFAKRGHLEVTLAAASPAVFLAVLFVGPCGLLLGLVTLSFAGIVIARKRRGGGVVESTGLLGHGVPPK